MTQQNHRANVWITPETREQLKEISMAHGGNSRKELSPGIRVAAGFHGRLVEVLEELCRLANDGDVACWLNCWDEARALLKEIEEAR